MTMSLKRSSPAQLFAARKWRAHLSAVNSLLGRAAPARAKEKPRPDRAERGCRGAGRSGLLHQPPGHPRQPAGRAEQRPYSIEAGEVGHAGPPTSSAISGTRRAASRKIAIAWGP